MGKSKPNRIWQTLSRLDEVIGMSMLVIMTVMTALNAILRYGFNFIINQAEEIAIISFLWMTYMGICANYKTETHVSINVLVDLLPERIVKVANVIITIFVTFISAVFMYYSAYMTNLVDKTTYIMRLSYFWVYLAMAVCFTLMTIYGCVKLVRQLQGKSTILQETGIVDALDEARMEKEAAELEAANKEGDK